MVSNGESVARGRVAELEVVLSSVSVDVEYAVRQLRRVRVEVWAACGSDDGLSRALDALERVQDAVQRLVQPGA